MIILWILLILTILAVSIGHRVSLALRLSRYQGDRMKAYCLAQAGIQRAIAELEIDASQNQYDTLSEAWSTGIDPATNKPCFEDIEIVGDSQETFTLKSPYDADTYFPITDEERKININTASDKLLLALLKGLNIEDTDAQQITNYIRIWRGDSGPNLQPDNYSENFKKGPFIVPEEVILILESFYQSKGEENYQQKAHETFDALKYLVTVCPTTKININTASRAVLTIFAKSAAIPADQQFVDGLITKVINFRTGDKGPFKADADISDSSDFYANDLTSDEKGIFNDMQSSLAVKSDYFDIGSTGNAGKISRKITAVYSREAKKIVYWHQD